MINFIHETHRWTLVGILIWKVQVNDPMSFLIGSIRRTYIDIQIPRKSTWQVVLCSVCSTLQLAERSLKISFSLLLAESALFIVSSNQLYYKGVLDLKIHNLPYFYRAVIIIDSLAYMNSLNHDNRAQYLKERNHKLASILVLLITIYEKIERLKQKLCGFSPNQFSPESIFEALDLTGKGYLDVYDIHSFLGNDRIRDRDILILFSRLGDQGQGRLTYLSYLALLKPFFDYELARDLLLRDTVTHRKNRDTENEQNLHEMQETVLILLNELILLHCISIAEHEELKAALIEEYMLNEIEIKEILGLGGRVSALSAIHEFIQCNSDYQVSKDQVKYILALAQTNEPSLQQERFINLLFIPSRPTQKKTKKETDTQAKTNRQLESLHANYTKDYLGKADLFTTSNRLSFLNYIHPNSYEKPTSDAPSFGKSKQKEVLKTEDHIEPEHNRLSISQQKMIYRPFKPETKPIQERDMTESIVQQSNLHRIRKPSERLQPVSYDKIETPILEQFMHESNIKRNMGNSKGGNRGLILNKVLEQSGLSESDAIVRVDYTSKQEKGKPTPYKYMPIKSRVEQPQFLYNHSGNQPSKLFGQNRSNISNTGNTSGILNQFLKSEFR